MNNNRKNDELPIQKVDQFTRQLGSRHDRKPNPVQDSPLNYSTNQKKKIARPIGEHSPVFIKKAFIAGGILDELKSKMRKQHAVLEYLKDTD